MTHFKLHRLPQVPNMARDQLGTMWAGVCLLYHIHHSKQKLA